MHRPRDIDAVVGALRRVRSRALTLLLAQRALVILAAVLGALLVLGAMDFALRFPAWIRALHLAVGVGVLAVALWRIGALAIAFRPSLTTIALRLERLHPELAGRLASAVDFARSGDASRTAAAAPTDAGSPVSKALADRAVRDIAASWNDDDAHGVVNPKRAVRAGAVFAGVAAACALVALLNPQLAFIGAARAVAPWSAAEWPKRTGVADATGLAVHPRGAALPLRAAVTKSNRDLESTQVVAQHRLIDADGRPGPIRTDLLTYQRREVELIDSRDGDASRGALFERLLETDAHAIEYRLRTADDETPWKRIRLIDPPRVLRAQARITPPEYARRLALILNDDAPHLLSAPQRLEMGPGMDERALAPPALAGSHIELTLTLNKPLPTPENPARDTVWLMRTFGPGAPGAGVEYDLRGEEWTLRWTLDESLRLPVALADEFGIESVEEAVYRFEAAQDRPPAATITEPANDIAVLATAVLDVVGEGRDDVGLIRVAIERRHARPAGEREPSGPGGALEPDDEPVEVVAQDAAGERALRVRARLDLATLGLRPGDELWLNALATDALASDTGVRGPTISPVRRIRIITENELIEDIRTELSGVRQAAIRADAQQDENREQTRARGSDRQTRRAQAQISERIARQQEAIERLTERVETNALDDDRLRDLLRDAATALDAARAASEQASQTLEDAMADARAQDPDAADGAPLNEEQQRQARDEQDRVRDELARLVEMLDAGQDGWVMQRRVEQLVRQQEALREQTRAAAAENAGLDAAELNEEQRSELERIVEKQRQLADEAQRLAEELPERADELRENDPAVSAGMRQAGQRAREENLTQTMEGAADQAESNQMSEAGRSQEEALETLRDMLEEFERGERSRQEELRRVLDSLIESLDTLIAQQETELARLDAAVAAGAPLLALDEGMIRLNRNTLGVLDLARMSGRELAPVARIISRASAAQIEAITGLRRADPDAPRIRAHEQNSLDRLIEAKREAQRIQQEQQQLEQARKQAELRREYARLLERQTSLRDQTAPYAEAPELNRRDRATVRALGEEQIGVRADLAQMLTRTRELAEARIFEFAHQRLDGATQRAGDALRAGEPAPAIPDQQRAIATLISLLTALQDTQQDEGDFGGGGGGGGGQGGGQDEQPLIPPIAELKLLREIQSHVMTETRAIADAPARPTRDAVERIGREQRSLAEIGESIINQMQRRGQGPTPDLTPAPDPDQPEESPAPEPPPAEAAS
ncbi:MAG: hypothetical protein EA379_05070 [Phycisphaerales bacterium]|nr:MAG: hypothetical protein EA379_05070 [Phycisphaerales bacterium]